VVPCKGAPLIGSGLPAKIWLGWNTNTLAYHDTVAIMVVKCFIVEAPEFDSLEKKFGKKLNLKVEKEKLHLIANLWRVQGSV